MTHFRKVLLTHYIDFEKKKTFIYETCNRAYLQERWTKWLFPLQREAILALTVLEMELKKFIESLKATLDVQPTVYAGRRRKLALFVSAMCLLMRMREGGKRLTLFVQILQVLVGAGRWEEVGTVCVSLPCVGWCRQVGGNWHSLCKSSVCLLLPVGLTWLFFLSFSNLSCVIWCQLAGALGICIVSLL